MRYLGVDYGSRRVGLAISDESGAMGFPHSVISNTKHIVSDVCEFIERERIEAVVIGESKNLSGEENAIAKDARAFGAAIALISQKPVFFESEVFTTVEARRAPAKEMKSRAPKQHTNVDASAAALILTSYLSHNG
jgi:putative Holliday junction resolvase